MKRKEFFAAHCSASSKIKIRAAWILWVLAVLLVAFLNIRVLLRAQFVGENFSELYVGRFYEIWEADELEMTFDYLEETLRMEIEVFFDLAYNIMVRVMVAVAGAVMLLGLLACIFKRTGLSVAMLAVSVPTFFFPGGVVYLPVAVALTVLLRQINKEYKQKINEEKTA